MNISDFFKNAEEWQKRIDAGESQVAIARDLGLSQVTISRTLKCGTLPSDEKQKYNQMILQHFITEGAVMDLAGLGDRRRALALAIEHRKVKDAEDAKRSGKKGMMSPKGKVTVSEIRAAAKELEAKKRR